MQPELAPAHTNHWWVRTRAVIRGVAGVAVFIAAAIEELVTAATGVPRPSRYAVRAARIVADEYRVRAAGAVDADVIDEQEETA